MRDVAEIVLHRHHHAVDGRDGEIRQTRLAQRQREVAALGNLQGVGQGAWHVREQSSHLLAGLEILLAGEFAHAAAVAEDFTFGNADARFMGLVVVGPQELDRVGGHHRQTEPRGQRHGGHDVALVVSPSGTLDFEVEAVREGTGQLQGQLGRARIIAREQHLPHRAGMGAREDDQPLMQLLKPFPFHGGLVPHHVTRPGTRQQLAEVQITLLALDQQQQTGQAGLQRRRTGSGLSPQALHHHVSTQQGLDARAARRLVELDGTEQVVEIGQRQGGLA